MIIGCSVMLLVIYAEKVKNYLKPLDILAEPVILISVVIVTFRKSDSLMIKR
jgi:hypothetical protein